MKTTLCLTEDLQQKIQAFASQAKTFFHTNVRHCGNELSFHLHIDPVVQYADLIEYIDSRCPPSIQKTIKQPIAMHLFVCGQDKLANIIQHMAHNHHLFKVAHEKFTFNQKIIALKKEQLILFYPSQTPPSEYPVLLKSENNFFIAIHNTSNKTKEFLFRLIEEIYISHFESLGWITYHGNSVLLANNKSIVVLGESGAGKTFFCTGLCRYRKAFYISDDRVMIKDNKNMLVPSVPYLDAASIQKLQVNPLLEISRTKKVPVQIHQARATEKKSLATAHSFGIAGIVLPLCDPAMKNKCQVIPVTQQAVATLLQKSCLTLAEHWRDEYMFQRYDKRSSRVQACHDQIQSLTQACKLVQIIFGPDVDFSFVEKKVLDSI